LRDAVEKDDEHDDIKPPIDVTPRQPLFNPPPAPAQVQGAQPDPDPGEGDGQDPQGEGDPQQAPPQDPQPTPTTELDVKREKIEKAFLAAGLNFDNLVAFLASRGQDVAETSFEELPEAVCNRLIRALDSFVKQAKALKEGGAQ
jgi:hypothetical protein